MTDTLRRIARFICYWLGFFSIGLVHWLSENFGSVTIPQLSYHLHFSTGLIASADSELLVTLILECIVGATLGAALLLAIDLYLDTRFLIRALMTLRMRPSSSVRRFGTAFRRRLPLILLSAGLVTLFVSLSGFSYIRALFTADRFAENYVDPAHVQMRRGNLKNLVIIYVESLETTFGESDLFGDDLIKEMNALPGVSFASYRQTLGARWTIAALIATQCGIPLQYVLWNPEGTVRSSEGFLPEATCLGDILAKYGYRNVFAGGAHLNFSAKGRFLKDHGYQERYGSTEWRVSKFEDLHFSTWGLYDDDLLRLAKQRLLELSRAGTLFNLTILTVDTHQPVGLYSKLCKAKGATTFEDVVRCTSGQIADFVDFAIKNDLMKDTNFVIIGDHLVQKNIVSDKLEQDPSRRRIFNKFISKEPLPKNREYIVHFDLFPTILELAGIEVIGNRLGLGCSAFFEGGPKCPIVFPEDEWLGNLGMSETYQRLWRTP